ncbi:hypothetical protein VIGAN_05255600 [Vigna angularis var. angularis]|uniref:DUF4220 domain-containing protein n=1 Tax=Vigna angularis var. angularis TaxID=157739 RepID=A0A0S3S7V7_PHAAN|nr:uncharacterized protein LOC108341117 [Vigna angularis]BAT88910.1 hypothetical protein VIGAN_05255600 [Vigna angularis var. angularis]
MVNPIPNFARNIWGKWNIQGVVLVSLTMQIVLIFIAPFRKRSRNTLLVSVLWFTYLVADVTAEFCVGLISNKYGDKDTAVSTIDDYLRAFWTPFLLLHLGGPDTITAFSLEDNELWLRHMLAFTVQVCLTGYVFLLTLPENTLLIPTVLVFMAGVIKFAERTISLQHASADNFRQSMIQNADPGPNYAKLMHELKSRQEAGLPAQIVTMPEISEQLISGQVDQSDDQHSKIPSREENDDQIDGNNPYKQSQEKETPISADSQPETPKSLPREVGDSSTQSDVDEKLSDLEVMKGAYDYFNKFKGLVVDMIFSFQERKESRTYLLQRTAVDALRVIEVELNFIYQAFYTKTTIIESWVGLFFRFLSIASVVAALVVFIFDEKRGCEPFDVTVTYVLLYGAVSLEVVSIFMFIFSDYSFAILYSRGSQKISDSDSGTRGGTETTKLDTTLSWVLKLKKPKWSKHKDNKPKWLKNEEYEVLKRFVLFRRWSETISAFNLISRCLDKKIKWLDWVIRKIGVEEFVEKWIYEKKRPLLQKLWIFIFNELKRKSGDAEDVESIQRICSSRGEWVIQEGDLSRDDLNKLMRYVERNDVTFDECLILWHIATDLLFYVETDEQIKKKIDAPDLEKGNHDDGEDGDKEGQNKTDEKKKKENNAHDLKQENHGDCEYSDIELRHFSKLLSDYMLYLVIMQPTMMSAIRGIGQKRFLDTCAEATNFFNTRKSIAAGEKKMREEDKRNKQHQKKNTSNWLLYQARDKLVEFVQFIKRGLSGTRWRGIIFKEKEEDEKEEDEDGQIILKEKKEDEDAESKMKKACDALHSVSVEYEPSAVKGDRSKSLLFDACKLASVIRRLDGTNKWRLMAEVWVELLSYAAANCIPITHVQQLSKGGEFLSIVWLLMTHLGLAKQFQIKEGHARAKLVVSEEYEEKKNEGKSS